MSRTMVLSPRGVMLEMSGLEEAAREALRARETDPALLAEMEAQLDNMLSDEALAGQPMFLALPGEAVSVGSTWESTESAPPNPMFGSMTGATSHRVESIDGDLVVIGSSATMSRADDTPDSFGMRVGDRTTVSTSRFDVGRGLFLISESTMRMQMSIPMAGEEMVMDTVTTMTWELVEGE